MPRMINSGCFKKGERRSIPTEFKKGTIPNNFIGRWEDGYGYVCIYSPNHPNKTKKNVVKEHRLIIEKHLGRYLDKKEVVHHINGIKNDNRLENLVLISNQGKHILIDHPRQKKCNTSSYRQCQACKKIKKLNEINFHKSPASILRFSYKCRPCCKEYNKKRWADKHSH